MAYILAPKIREVIKTFAEGRQITMGKNYNLACLTMAHSAELNDILCNRSISRWIAKYAYGYSPDESIAWCRRAERSAEEGSEIFFGLFDNESNKLVAVAGITPETNDDGTTSAEIGYVIAQEYHGKNIAVKLIKFLIDFAFKELNIARIYSTTAQGNLASHYILRKVGLENIGQTIIETNGKSPRLSYLFECRNPLFYS